MTVPFRASRRRALAVALAGVLAAGAAPARAQDARANAAQGAARDWLALTDRAGAKPSWDAAGAKFREVLSADRWEAAFRQVRGPLGAVDRRTVVATRFATTLKGFPPGDYAFVQFRSSYARREVVNETVTLERETSGAWRVVGYALS